MQDDPKPIEILASVAALLRDDIAPQLSGSYAFQLRVAINAIELVRREMAVSACDYAHIDDALKTLLQRDAGRDELIGELAKRIAARTLDPDEPDVAALLWAITEAKLDIDQPRYAGLVRARDLRARVGRNEPARQERHQ